MKTGEKIREKTEEKTEKKIGEITGLYIFKEKGKPGILTDKVSVTAQAGITGDRHCYDKNRQISLMSREASDWMKDQDIEGLCFHRFKANIVFELTGQMPEGKMRAGEAVIALDRNKKQCFDQCIRHQRGMDCMLKEQCWFATGVSEGEVCLGDAVTVEYDSDDAG